MLLVHKAMAGGAERVEREADQLDEGSSLQPFRAAFNERAAAFMYLAEREDELFSGDAAGHADTATPEDGARAAMLAANKDEHCEMDEKFQGVMGVLNVEIGRTSAIRRRRQYLFGSVLALRIAQQDHIENERAFVLPALKQRLSSQEQLDLTRELLVDSVSSDPRWVLDWIGQHLISRIRERYLQTGDNDEAVAYGLRSTAGLITGAALIMVAIFSGFAAGDLIPTSQFGFGMAVAILLDATIIRSVLVPSTMKILGDRNWYLPGFLNGLPQLQAEDLVSEPQPAAGGDA
jgi:hypothetical protein